MLMFEAIWHLLIISLIKGNVPKCEHQLEIFIPDEINKILMNYSARKINYIGKILIENVGKHIELQKGIIDKLNVAKITSWYPECTEIFRIDKSQSKLGRAIPITRANNHHYLRIDNQCITQRSMSINCGNKQRKAILFCAFFSILSLCSDISVSHRL